MKENQMKNPENASPVFYGETRQKSSGTDSGEEILRVMYYNVYGYEYLDSIPERIGKQMDLITDYAPDVLCTQEFDRLHRAGAKSILEERNYREVPVGKDGACLYSCEKNCEAMFYRSDRLEFVHCGGVQYPDKVKVEGVEVVGNNGNSKSSTWAVFRVRKSGQLFLAVNTHFMWSAPELSSKQANAVRVDNAKRMLELIQSIRSMDPGYQNLPVIFGGDLNCDADSDPYATLKAVLSPTYEIAENRRDNIGYYGTYATYDAETQSYHYGKVPSEGIGIDHIFAENVTVLNHFTVTEFRALITSDHLPKIVDFILNERKDIK